MTGPIPLIISGAPRSGTSLLYNLFDGHSQVSWLIGEGYLFEYLHDCGDAGIMLDAVPEDIDALVEGLRDKQVIPPLHRPHRQARERGSMSEQSVDIPWNEQRFRDSLAGGAGPGVARLWRRLVLACLAGLGQEEKRYACLKSPDYGKSAVAALSLLPNARSLVIVRDPVLAIDSLKQSRQLRGEKLLTWPNLALTIRQFQHLHDRVQSLAGERLLWIRYETLVAEPEAVMGRIADWLGIPFESCLIQATILGVPWSGHSSFAPTTGIETAPAARSIMALTAREVDVVRKHLTAFNADFGYAGAVAGD